MTDGDVSWPRLPVSAQMRTFEERKSAEVAKFKNNLAAEKREPLMQLLALYASGDAWSG